MKVVALVSGGKDSCYVMMKCHQYGHEIVALANLMPADDAQDELDSYMYQTVGHQIVVGYAKCMGVPLFRRRIQGSTRHHELSYNMTYGDEVEDMFILLNEVKRQFPSITAVSSGAIASDYQRLRVENVCSRLGLVSLAYLWRLDQALLLQEMIQSGIVAITVKVAAIGLVPSKHLGKEISFLESHLHKLKELYGINVCGEGGEYETLTLDCPLFKHARIVLDEFQVVLHSSDSIAPVGILHPLAFHWEEKISSSSLSDCNGNDGVGLVDLDSVCEVTGDFLQGHEPATEFVNVTYKLDKIIEQKIRISRTRTDGSFSFSCWLEDSSGTSDLQEDLKVALMKIELQLAEYGFSWENVLYIHLYIADMNEFATANETYVRHITQEKCRLGVPSRSTVELPLSEVGLGRAYVEILVANDCTKRVLHVQSISCWAPSCIGPYSQATLHQGILYMAGQLGLNPATMLLCDGGPIAEFEQSLENSEAVAKCFNCSISTSAILFVIYCSNSMSESDKIGIENKKHMILEQMKSHHLYSMDKSEVLDPIFLCVLLPDLPKRAMVEVKPMLYAAEDVATGSVYDPPIKEGYGGFQHESWHDTCLEKCIVSQKICAAALFVTDEIAARICPEPTSVDSANVDHKFLVTEKQMERIAKFCIYILDEVLLENYFSWDDVMVLRLYFPTRLGISHKLLSHIFTNVFNEFACMSRRTTIDTETMFSIIPVLGIGKSAMTMNDILVCELFSRKL